MTRHKRDKEQEDLAEKTRDRKGESNDSPEIPDRRMTSDIPGLPSGKEKGGSGGRGRREMV